MIASTFGVVGLPVAHSKSPRMHEAAYRAAGLPHRYLRLETPAAELGERVAALRAGTYAGLNVTVPHKQRVLSLVDVVAPSARAVGAANTLVRTPEGAIEAHNTDAEALRRDLASMSEVAGNAGLVLGSGGAARAAVFALAGAGAKHVVVRARAFGDPQRARAFTESFDVGVPIDAGPMDAPPRERDDLRAIVQATSCGMTGGPPGEASVAAVAWETVPKATFALDVVYAPRITPFLARARAEGLRAEDGLRMLALQGALAYQLWLGGEPPFATMLAAVVDPGP